MTSNAPATPGNQGETCGHTLHMSPTPVVCIRPDGHPDEHIGMFGNAGLTVVIHFGSLDDMAGEMSRLASKVFG